MNRRMFLAGAIAGVAAAQQSDLPEPIRKLKPMLDGVQPITAAERAARVEKARRLMREHKMSAIYLESGTSMYYFTGKREPGQAWILPLKGEPVWTPAEPPKPRRHCATAASRPGLGIEERVRFVVFDGLRKEAPALECVSATPVTAGCRMIKSPAEIALMQRANDITIEAYKAALATLREGMTQHDLSANIAAAYPRARRTAAARWSSSASTPRSRTAASSRRSCAKATWC